MTGASTRTEAAEPTRSRRLLARYGDAVLALALASAMTGELLSRADGRHPLPVAAGLLASGSLGACATPRASSTVYRTLPPKASVADVQAFTDGRPSRVFTMLSDGELDEGSVWEAVLFAPHHKLDNLIAVVDRFKSS